VFQQMRIMENLRWRERASAFQRSEVACFSIPVAVDHPGLLTSHGFMLARLVRKCQCRWPHWNVHIFFQYNFNETMLSFCMSGERILFGRRETLNK
jgi:hypothetical protein